MKCKLKILLSISIIISLIGILTTYADTEPIIYALDNNYEFNYNKLRLSEGVLIGDDGWTFYDPYITDNVRADYLGLNLFSNEELSYYLDKLIYIKNKLAVKGIDFYLFFAPNKNRVYSEYYKNYVGEMADEYRLKQFVDYVRANSDIKVVYPIEELLDAKYKLPDKVLYHKYDSHWNFLGGYVGAYSLLKKMNVDIPYVDKLRINEVESDKFDLLDLNNIPHGSFKDVDYNIYYSGNKSAYTYVFKDEKIASYASYDPIDNRRILMCNDSYFAAMSVPMSISMNNIMSIMFTEFEEKYFDEYAPDIFVFEALERTLKNRLDYFISQIK